MVIGCVPISFKVKLQLSVAFQGLWTPRCVNDISSAKLDQLLGAHLVLHFDILREALARLVNHGLWVSFSGSHHNAVNPGPEC